MRVATTQVPIFDGRMQTPIFGYRSLGFFSRFSSVCSTPLYISAINSPRTWDAPEIVAWKACLCLLGAHPDAHFIMILSHYDEPQACNVDTIPSSPSQSPLHSCRGSSPRDLHYNTASPGSAPYDNCYLGPYSPVSPSGEPFTGFEDQIPYGPFEDLMAEFQTPGSSPIFPFVESSTDDVDMNIIQLPTPSSTASSPFDHPYIPHFDTSIHDLSSNLPHAAEIARPVEDWSRLVPGLTVAEALREGGIAETQPALYDRAQTSLWEMFQNHRYAAKVLAQLGLSDEKENSHRRFAGGLELTTAQVIRHLGWSPRTFIRKSVAYRQARELATYTWRGPPPTRRDHGAATLDSYRLWQQVVAMFCVGGFIDQHCAPSRDGLTNEEQLVASLCQNNLYKNLNELRPLLASLTRLHPHRYLIAVFNISLHLLAIGYWVGSMTLNDLNIYQEVGGMALSALNIFSSSEKSNIGTVADKWWYKARNQATKGGVGVPGVADVFEENRVQRGQVDTGVLLGGVGCVNKELLPGACCAGQECTCCLDRWPVAKGLLRLGRSRRSVRGPPLESAQLLPPPRGEVLFLHPGFLYRSSEFNMEWLTEQFRSMEFRMQGKFESEHHILKQFQVTVDGR
ncbi:hypothetical protein DFH07DRAFT_1028229 [Mycena maculata]|uniref:Uncharacterized protein n=1 Tax=Mycena maculata TaxID=230809 RepID=A0AAD7J576_9AGAR|nr:hypothetical protein DFH07DRAFT_1028229 [Mycena maculata]